MRRSLGGVPRILLLLATISLSAPAFAQQQFTLTPSLSISETYDDNILLSPSTKKTDYITIVSPGMMLDLEKQHTGLQLSYSPSIVRYAETSANDTIRHQAAANYRQDVTEKLRFNLIDNYLKSEDPLESTEGIYTVRRTRNPYQRNSGEGSLTYLFGPENTVTAGYRNYILLNTDPTIDDSLIQEPYGNFTYWFDIHHGMEFTYRYTVGSFFRDGGSAQPDFTGNSPGLRYLYRFSPQTRGSASYIFTERSFDQRPNSISLISQDYTVHSMLVGADHQFSAQTTAEASVGYFIQQRDVNELSGYSYRAYLNRTFQRGRFRIGGAGGWDEQYLQLENRGFVRFYSGEASGEYFLLEPLSVYAGLLYRHDTLEDNTVDQNVRGNAGLRWTFYRWYSLVLNYAYSKRMSDNPLNEYDDNRVMLILSWTKPYRL